MNSTINIMGSAWKQSFFLSEHGETLFIGSKCIDSEHNLIFNFISLLSCLENGGKNAEMIK